MAGPIQRIIYAGTPQFAVPPLARLLETGHAPIAVFTQPDRPAGRGRKNRPNPVKILAESHQIPVFQPETLKNRLILEDIRSSAPDLMVVAAYGLILPQAVLDLPRLGCWNIHASLLPRWRGAAPIQRAIEAGDRQTGVCIMQMEADLDTGPVLHSHTTDIGPHETAGDLHDRLSVLGADALETCLAQLAQGSPPAAVPQDDALAVHAPKLSKAEAELDWTRPADKLERQVRAFNPWPVSWFMHGDERLRVWRARALPGESGARPGSILPVSGQALDIATGRGVLRLLEVQAPGRRRMPVSDYLNARPPA